MNFLAAQLVLDAESSVLSRSCSGSWTGYVAFLFRARTANVKLTWASMTTRFVTLHKSFVDPIAICGVV